MIGYSPDAETESLQALTRLLKNPTWREDELAPSIRVQIAARLDDDEVHIRLLALRALPVLYPVPDDAASALRRRIDLEGNHSLLATAVGLLRVLPYELADEVLTRASEDRTGGPKLGELVERSDERDTADLRQAWVTAHLNCYLQASTQQATRATMAWFTYPSNHVETFQAALSTLRSIVSFNSTGPFRGPCFELLGLASKSLTSAPRLALTDPATVVAINSLVQELYFASGAHEGNQAGDQPTPSQRTGWYNDAILLLEQLAAVAVHAHTCYQLLETLEYLVDEDPTRVFHAVAATIKATGAFRFEHLGMEIAARLVNRYLADYRDLFVKDKDLLSKLRSTLEIFAQVGWPEALDLSYSLGDVFR